jgi:outer membrane biogenesis lipoprotein LolB
MKKISRAIALLLVGSTLLSGCSMMTAQGRRQRAYERYVRKSSQGRVKQQKRFAAKGNTMPVIHVSEPMETTEASGPESVGDGGGQ